MNPSRGIFVRFPLLKAGNGSRPSFARMLIACGWQPITCAISCGLSIGSSLSSISFHVTQITPIRIIHTGSVRSIAPPKPAMIAVAF